jgi:hypothetical protein
MIPAGIKRSETIIAWLFLVTVFTAVSFIVAWHFRITTTHNFNVELCQGQERQNQAMRLIIDARLGDPTTPEPVKRSFRLILAQYLQPQNCDHLP